MLLGLVEAWCDDGMEGRSGDRDAWEVRLTGHG
jgi:hypothetical protein